MHENVEVPKSTFELAPRIKLYPNLTSFRDVPAADIIDEL